MSISFCQNDNARRPSFRQDRGTRPYLDQQTKLPGAGTIAVATATLEFTSNAAILRPPSPPSDQYGTLRYYSQFDTFDARRGKTCLTTLFYGR